MFSKHNGTRLIFISKREVAMSWQSTTKTQILNLAVSSSTNRLGWKQCELQMSREAPPLWSCFSPSALSLGWLRWLAVLFSSKCFTFLWPPAFWDLASTYGFVHSFKEKLFYQGQNICIFLWHSALLEMSIMWMIPSCTLALLGLLCLWNFPGEDFSDSMEEIGEIVPPVLRICGRSWWCLSKQSL